ncbi:MAG: class I SAM-dependent methyltransferase [Sulfuricellaceae bacterium]|jgi:SAM-dependent methyltransferase
MTNPSLKNLESHFSFGENWSSFSQLANEERLASAVQDLVKLFGEQGVAGKRFLDIGCGSGLHSAAAARLGAKEIVAVDIDPKSVETTQKMLARFVPQTPASVFTQSVFDLDPSQVGQFDIVYSWGVLHHTGDMYGAIDKACKFVQPGGLLMLALYRKTWCCPLWKLEKKWYSKASPAQQKAASDAYIKFMKLRFRIKGRDFGTFVSDFHQKRGMSFEHDVHDWLGGYPYESISPKEIDTFLKNHGFSLVTGFFKKRRKIGLMGSGCDSYVYRLTDHPAR